MKLMVFDVGGTEIKYCVMDESLVREEAGSVPTPMSSQEEFFDLLCSLYEPHRGEVEGIAMCLPGFIDSENGRCLGGGALRYNQGRDVAGPLSERTGVPVHIANDGKCAALAELRDGALRGCRNASVYIIGTGVGGGLIINGDILNGSHFTAGEYSFLRLTNTDWDDPGTTAGIVCSTTGLLDLNRRFNGFSSDPLLNGVQFFEKVNAGDRMSIEVLKRFCRQVAMQIANLTILLDLEKVAVGGGISRQPVLIKTIRECLDEIYANPGPYFDPALPRTQIVPCRYGSEANQVGAYYYYQMAKEQKASAGEKRM